jgi:hypothetical protein
LAQSEVRFLEFLKSQQEYPDHLDIALGHLAEAEDAVAFEYKDLAAYIRSERINLEKTEFSENKYPVDYLGMLLRVRLIRSVNESATVTVNVKEEISG